MRRCRRDLPTEAPVHDFTCTDAAEPIRYTADFGATAPTSDGVEVTLEATGAVVAVRDTRGGPIPPDGAVLAGTGDAATWLRDHAVAGTTLAVEAALTADGEPLAVGDDLITTPSDVARERPIGDAVVLRAE